ncbi:MAG: hypothetical protein PWR27_2294 [Petroclostridium sp.]|nr:hypothetical protein [Petroclostridium sp.]
MHKEVVKRQGNTFLTVIGLVVLVFACMSILDAILAVSKYSFIIDLISIGIITAFGYMVLRYMVIDFKYLLIDTDLIFQKVLGNRETVVLNINTEDVVIIAPITSKALKNIDKVEKTYNLCATLFGKRKYCGIFAKDGKNYKIVFEPSEKLIKLLKRSIPDKVIE